MISMNYNVHDKLKIRISPEKDSRQIGIDSDEMKYFHVKDIDAPNMTLNIGEFSPANDGCCIVDNKYYVKKNYFYCKDLNSSIKWETEIKGFEEGDQEINLHYTTTSPKVMLFSSVYRDFVLRPLIYKKLFDNGACMIHAAGVVKDGSAYVFPGRGGSFKTSIVTDLLRSGRYQFLGDDRVILHENKVLSFPTFLPVIDYIYRNKENERINMLDKLRIMRSPPNPGISLAESGNLKKMFFLIRSTDSGLSIHDLDNKAAVDKLVTSIDMETSDQFESCHVFPYYKYIQIYSYVYPNGPLAHYKDNLRRTLSAILSDVEKYEIRVPYDYNINVHRAIDTLINES